MTRIEKEYVFESAVHFNNRFILNIFDLNLSMLVETDNIREQNVAMDRVNFFIDNILDDCIFVAESEKEVIQKYKDAGIRVCTLPEEPYDQIIGAVILLKLNAIMENRLVITDISFGSKMSDGIRFSIIEEEAENAFSGKYWWNQATTAINHDIISSESKVVDFSGASEWAKLDLSWKEKS